MNSLISFRSGCGHLRRLFLVPVVILCCFAFQQARGQVPDIQVEEVGGNYIASGTTANFGPVNLNSSATKTFRVRNTGSGFLTGLSLVKQLDTAGRYSVSPVSGSLAPGATTSFSVTFTPTQIAVATAQIRIISNDPKPTENPYIINLSGMGASVAIAVSQSGRTLEDAVSTVNFGNVGVGIRAARVFTIRNAGNAELKNLSLSISGTGFSTSALNVTTLASGASTTVTVYFQPAFPGGGFGVFRIFSNDTAHSPFDINLQATAVQALMEVEQPAGTLLVDDSSTVDFGSVDPGGSVIQEFVLRNLSNGYLTGLTVSVDGVNAPEFIAEPLPADILEPGATLTFSIRFLPSSPGERLAVAHVGSNQALDNPFDILLRGEGTALSDLGDADGDGTVNLMEQATGSDPLVPGPQPGEVAVAGGNLEITFSKKAAYAQLVYYTVEWSDNLVDWNGVPEENVTLLSDDGDIRVVRYAYPVGTRARYLRLRVTRV